MFLRVVMRVCLRKEHRISILLIKGVQALKDMNLFFAKWKIREDARKGCCFCGFIAKSRENVRNYCLFLYFLHELRVILEGRNSLVLVWLSIYVWVKLVLNTGLGYLGIELSLQINNNKNGTCLRKRYFLGLDLIFVFMSWSQSQFRP